MEERADKEKKKKSSSNPSHPPSLPNRNSGYVPALAHWTRKSKEKGIQLVKMCEFIKVF